MCQTLDLEMVRIHQGQSFRLFPMRAILVRMEKQEFGERFDGKQRKSPVSVRYETITSNKHVEVQRPTAVWGRVEVGSTKGRGKAPNPMGQPRGPLAVDQHRGHLMALELGGPDEAPNIVPQWAMMQSNGDWREMEKKVKADAQKLTGGRYMLFGCAIKYYDGANLAWLRMNRLVTPVGFLVETRVYRADGTQEGERTVRWNFAQAQNETDGVLVLRQEDLMAMEYGEPRPHVLFPDITQKRAKGGSKAAYAKKQSKEGAAMHALHAPPEPPSLTYRIPDDDPHWPFAVEFVTRAEAAKALPVPDDMSDEESSSFMYESPSSSHGSYSADEDAMDIPEPS
jgi:DNA/RNA non-specific endonuclease